MFFNWTSPASYSFIFCLFQTRKQINVKKGCRYSSVDLSASSIHRWCAWDSNLSPCSSPKHTIYAFINLLYWFVSCEKDENKQKEAGIGLFFLNVKNDYFSIRCRHLNSRPPDCASPPTTITWPRLCYSGKMCGTIFLVWLIQINLCLKEKRIIFFITSDGQKSFFRHDWKCFQQT